MSDIRIGSSRRIITVVILPLVAILCLSLPQRGEAQSASEWNTRYLAAVAESKSAIERYNALVEQSRTMQGGSIVAGGQTVEFESLEITARDRELIAAGLELGAARLRARVGGQSLSLADRAVWRAYPIRTGCCARGYIRLGTSRWSGGSGVFLPRPVDPEQVADFVMTRAGVRLIELIPALHSYGGWDAFGKDDPSGWAFVPRTLGVSWAAAGRHCAAGADLACRAVLTPFDPSTALHLLFEPSDYQTVVVAGRVAPTSDSAFFASRRRCLDGADSACARIVTQVGIPDPIGSSIRGSLLAHALELGGADAVDRLLNSSATEAIPLLAHSAGVSEDSLIRSWRARNDRSLVERRGSGIVLFASTAAWAALLLLVTTRRRPA